MAIDIKKKLKKERNRSFLAKDFNAFRAELLNYARTYFPDKIQDFSEEHQKCIRPSKRSSLLLLQQLVQLGHLPNHHLLLVQMKVSQPQHRQYTQPFLA